MPRGYPELNRRFDLALCIEVAEHLRAERGDELIEYLCARADSVLFSAAVPGQGGTGHINEQPQSYWHARFAEHDYVAFDLVRPALWARAEVNVIYRQNMLCYVRDGSSVFHELVAAGKAPLTAGSFELDRVHPELFARRERQRRQLGFAGHAKLALKSLLGRG